MTEAFATENFAGQNPIGRTVVLGTFGRRMAGSAGRLKSSGWSPTRNTRTLREEPQAAVYAPLAHNGMGFR